MLTSAQSVLLDCAEETLRDRGGQAVARDDVAQLVTSAWVFEGSDRRQERVQIVVSDRFGPGATATVWRERRVDVLDLPSGAEDVWAAAAPTEADRAESAAISSAIAACWRRREPEVLGGADGDGAGK
ncbi:MAG: hypothetical protein H6697_00250 [Myxococcales bacterium]|nr:hypothetical protein [Myxococcales bacterium]